MKLNPTISQILLFLNSTIQRDYNMTPELMSIRARKKSKKEAGAGGTQSEDARPCTAFFAFCVPYNSMRCSFNF